jgi:hypothetical protein
MAHRCGPRRRPTPSSPSASHLVVSSPASTSRERPPRRGGTTGRANVATAHCRLPARVVSVLAIAGAVVASPRAAEMMNTHDRVPAHPQTHLVRTADAVPLSAAGGKWGTVKRPFRAAFNQRIPVNPVIAPRSQAIVAHLGRNRAAYANLHDYGTPIYYADRSTPRALVNCTRRWGPCDLEQGRVRLAGSRRT